MTTMTDSNDVERRRKLARGPYGQITSRYALHYGKAAFFGSPPNAPGESWIKNGTIAFVDLGNGPIGITCAHVIKGYREEKSAHPTTIFQIGHLEIDPEGFFGNAKRSLDGHHNFSHKYNTREESDGFRTDSGIKGIDGKRLTLKDPLSGNA